VTQKCLLKEENLAPSLEREEWFFGKVPKDEVITCFYYEYARSRDDICQLVRSWREKLANLDKAYDDANTDEMRMARCGRWDETFASKDKATHEFWGELAQLTDWTCAQLLLNLPQFPDAPWQRLPSWLKAKYKNFLPRFYGRLETIRGGLREESWDRVVEAIRCGDFVTKFGEIVPFLIDFRGGVERVIDDFEVWARKRWHALKLKKKPRETYREWLKQPGVMRLKDKIKTWPAILDYAWDELKYPLYGDDHALWKKARLAAFKRKNNLFPIKKAH
jgi:hypothetical protein